METTLHRQLKERYAAEEERREVTVDGFRIDAVVDDRLVEVQSASLSAIRDKIRDLVQRHDVLVVKPLAARKLLVKYKRRGGKVASRRYSPKSESVYDLFLELVHFVPLFPHPRLTLQVLLTEQEEHRVPRRRRRWNGPDFRVQDRALLDVVEEFEFRTAADLCELLPPGLPAEFTTADVARQTKIPRWLAQKMAYCLRKTGAAEVVGKQGNSIVYALSQRRADAA
ncbi:MAG: hypothetical protein DWQ45_03205 [Planctomycetota bacterium]|nr:MAG: hypothetical protein DWQ41_22910 [Planctomycetota bacterium]REK38867.1 MAG: hypothetical protein DWQ45_03205 [Planctomycetota bacterium]